MHEYVATICILLMLINITSPQIIARASYRENCSKDIRCETRNFLTCSVGQCDCMMPDSMVFEKESGRCVTLAGERCQYNTFEGENTWTEEVPCISFALCRNGICECDENHFEIANGTCEPKREYGEECFNNEMCDSSLYLVCGNDETCKCGPSRILSATRCVVAAQMACSPNVMNDCVHFSTCDNVHSICTCFEDYFPAEDGQCVPKKSYGQNCSHSSECGTKSQFLDPVSRRFYKAASFLTCDTGICKCIKGTIAENTPFDGNRCAREAGEIPENESCQGGECVIGAVCQPSSTGGNMACYCDLDKYFQAKNKTCEERRSFGSECASDDQCEEEMECDNQKNTCACLHNEIFNPNSETCVVKAGNQCGTPYNTNDKPCVPNSSCKGNRYKTCTCDQNTEERFIQRGDYCYVNENGKCKDDTVDPITSSDVCLPGLFCRNATCQCEYKEHQRFSGTQCYSLIGGPCNKTSDCNSNIAECKFHDGFQQCVCKEGFTEVDRACEIAYGGKCEQYGYHFNYKCDSYGPLECSSRKICECSDFQIYDRDQLKCRGLTGAKCYPSNSGFSNQDENFCVDDATCKPFRGFRSVLGLCICEKGWTTEANRTCSPVTMQSTTEKIVEN